jgi:hypothetical protein
VVDDPQAVNDKDRLVLRARELKTKKAGLWRELATKARLDVNVFAQWCFGLVPGDIHRRMHTHYDAYDRAGVLAPADHGKTTQFLVRIIWTMGREPDALHKLVCSTDDVAVDRLKFIRETIERNEKVRFVFPSLKKSPFVDDWGKMSLTIMRRLTSKDPTIEAAGVLTTGTGGRADYLWFDDIVDYNNAIKYPTARKQVIQTVKSVWIPMLGPKGKARYIATRWHTEDATAWLEANESWKWLDLSLPADLSDIKWPERWGKPELMGRRGEIGEVEFERRYCNIIRPDKDRIIQEAFIRRVDGRDNFAFGFRILSFDFATKVGKDRTARAVIDVSIKPPLMRVLAAQGYAHLGHNEKVDLILSEIGIWIPTVTLGEANGFQSDVGTDERLAGFVIPVLHKISKAERVKNTRVWYERGLIEFVDDRCEEGIKELLDFTAASTKDDVSDAITQGILHAIVELAKNFRPEEAHTSSPRTFKIEKAAVDPQAEGDRRPRVFGPRMSW